LGQDAESPGYGIPTSKGSAAAILRAKWLLEILKELLTLADEGIRSFETESSAALLRKSQ
jgi:hypothetical protein